MLAFGTFLKKYFYGTFIKKLPKLKKKDLYLKVKRYFS